jgi:hypothetical protein
MDEKYKAAGLTLLVVIVALFLYGMAFGFGTAPTTTASG